MTAIERRASATLSSIFALRMLGLFLVLPVFPLEARKYPGGDDPALIGIAMGIYGLTQGILQIPFGIASDKFGRKPVIILGLLVFAVGSLCGGYCRHDARFVGRSRVAGCWRRVSRCDSAVGRIQPATSSAPKPWRWWEPALV
jgi:MFS family permease